MVNSQIMEISQKYAFLYHAEFVRRIMFIDWTFKLPFSPVTGSLVPVLMFTPNPFCGCVPSCSFACMSANPTHHCPPHWQRDGPALHDRIFRFDVGIDHVCCYSSDVRADSGKRGGIQNSPHIASCLLGSHMAPHRPIVRF